MSEPRRSDDDGAASADVRAYLHGLGATDEDIAHAGREGWLPLLVFNHALMPGVRRYDAAAIAAAAGVDETYTRRLWRALGFPDVPGGIDVFTDADLEALRGLLARVPATGDTAATLRQARAISSAMARIAAVEAELLADGLDQLRATGMNQAQMAEVVVDRFEWSEHEALVDYVHRLQLRAAVWRHLAREGPDAVAVAVGFADLASYTTLTEELDAPGLVELVSRWEDLAYDIVASNGARVVKTIGDEVMYVGLPADVCRIAVTVRDAAARDALLPMVRIGFASGDVVAHDGDYFGPAVNLASRMTGVAGPGEILTSDGTHAGLSDVAGLSWARHGTHKLRGIGPVELWELEGIAGAAPS